ncbi:MFS transporter [Microbacterium mangrovi]|uniref:MFS transporter n=1 Tax=Microbacterium mangrovi TaxID=1348253 RepID=UPI00068DDBCA|nr:MFS transporter [Microbacterium mangrovi]
MSSEAPTFTAAVRSSSPRPFAYILAVLILAAITSSFESTMMYTSLPSLEEGFGVDISAVSWVLTGFLLVGAASAAISGRLGDVFGRKRVLLILLVASVLGSVISLAVPTIGGVILGRAIQGLAVGILPLAFGIIREHVSAKNLSTAIAVTAGAAMLAGATGNLVAGYIVQLAGWHWIFVVSGALTIITAVLAVWLPASIRSGARDRIDWLGGILFAPGIALILFGINISTGLGWASAAVWGAIGLGALVLVFWAVWEFKRKAPMVNVRYFGQRNLGITFLVTALTGFGLGGAGYLGQLIMQYPTAAPVGFGIPAGAAGLTSFCIGLFGFLLSPLSGRIARGGRAKTSFIISAITGILAAILTALSATVWDSFPAFIVSQVVLTISTSFLLSSLPLLVVEGSSSKNTSEATGLQSVIQTAFSGVGTSVSSAILAVFAVQLTPTFHPSSEQGYNVIFALTAILTAIALVAALFLKRRPAPVEQPDEAPNEGLEAPVHAI